MLVVVTHLGCGLYTNKKHQPFCWSFLNLHAVLAHAMDNWAHKINRENAVDVHKVEYHRHNEQAIPPELRHGKDCGRARLS